MKKNVFKKNVKSFAWNRKNITIVSAVASVLVMGTVWGGIKLYSKSQPVRIDLSGKSEEQIRAYMTSEEFKKLDRAVQRQYGRAAMEQGMEKRMNGFFEVAPEQRTAYLDKMIDEMQERIKQMPARDAGGGPRGGPAGMRARMEKSTPEQRAKFTEFFGAMRKRMKERGLDFRPGGGRR